MLIDELNSIGLSDKEAKVYLAALELGRATVQEISRKSGVNRATTYIQIETLTKRGLIGQIDNDKKCLIVAEKPQRIIEILEKEKGDIQQLEDKFVRLLPDLQAIYNVQSDKPRVRFYQNEVGLEMVRNDIIKTNPEALYSFVPMMNDEIITNMSKFSKKLKSNHVLYVSKNDIQINAVPAENLLIRQYLLDNFSVEISMYANKVLINKPISHDNSMGVLIEDKLVFSSFLAIFNLFWDNSKEIK